MVVDAVETVAGRGSWAVDANRECVEQLIDGQRGRHARAGVELRCAGPAAQLVGSAQ